MKAALIVIKMRDKYWVKILGPNIEDQIDEADTKTLSMKEKKLILYDIQSGICNGCRTQFRSRNLTIDHIKPQSKVKDDRISNLQLLCSACNSLKGNRTQAYLIKQLKKKQTI